VNLQVKTTYKPRDVFRSNKYNSIQANIEEIQESGLQVEVFLVRSADNQADPVSKFQESSKDLVKSDQWLRGVEWMRKERSSWPVVDVNVQPKREEKAKSGEEDEEVNTCQDQVSTTLLTSQTQPVKKSKSEKHIFSGTIERCSRVDVLIRAVARVKNIFKNKSFKTKDPSFQDEEDAFSTLVRMEQKIMRMPPKNLLVKNVDGLQVTSQRWSPQEHIDLFGAPHLPLLPVEERLGHLLLHRAHRPPRGPCAGDRHTLQRLRSLKHQVYLFGAVHQVLRKLRSSCVFCLKQKCEKYEPQIKFDNFKTSTIRPWSSISIDMWGHFLTSDQPRQTTRRTRTIYKKKYVLGVIDNSGLAALNLIPMADASAKSFCTALMTHFAETNVVASEIYSDCGTNFLAVARQENNNSNNNDNHNDNGDDSVGDLKQSLVSKEIKEQFPGIRWIQTKSNSQWRNGLIERSFGLAKQYVHNVFHTKQTDPLPHFTSEGLWLLCKEMSNFFNQRVISWLKAPGLPLTPNMFLKTYLSPSQEGNEIWSSPYGLEKAFQNLEQYRSKMRQYLREFYQSASFPATKWYSQKNVVAKGDIVLHCRNQSKFSKGTQEYGLVVDFDKDQRNIEITVNRKGVKKNVSVDARNLIPILKTVQEN